MIKQLLQLAPALGLLMFGPCTGGCTLTLTDSGMFGVRQTTGIEFYHTATGTGKTAVSNIELPAVVEYFLNTDDQVSEPVETLPGG